MSRTSPPLLATTMLLVGVVLGMALERGGPTVAAQATGGVSVAPPPARGLGPDTRPASGTTPARAEATGARPEDALYDELARDYERFRHVDQTFERVARAVAPAVVHIVARKAGRREGSHRFHYEETGSGVIVRDDGGRGLFVLTNHHVIEGASPADVTVSLQDGRALRPKHYWLDSKADIAVLKLDRDDLPSARLGNSDEAAVGSWVLALGSPFGLTHSVSQGIISAKGRHEEELERDGVVNQDFLQTDAAINPGNSGGPLVNLRGEVIGINTAIASNGGGSEGVGFSIPINLARWIMGQLITSGRVNRGAMGVDLHMAMMTHDEALAMGLDRPRGAWIDAVRKGSPAAAAGLQANDVVLRFNGVDVIDLNHLINLVSMYPIGQTAEVVLWRDRREIPARVTIADQGILQASTATPPPPARTPPTPSAPSRRPARPGPDANTDVAAGASRVLGLELLTLDEALARRLGLPATLRGAVVARVEPTSPLAAHVRPLDVIHAVDGRGVDSAEEAARALTIRPERTPIELRLQRLSGGGVRGLVVQVPR